MIEKNVQMIAISVFTRIPTIVTLYRTTNHMRGNKVPTTKQKKRASKAKERKAKTRSKLPEKFEPKFWRDCDKRQIVLKEIRQRIERLEEDAGADSYQKQLLVQRAVFLSVQLETWELNAAEGQEFDAGVYTQAANALSGLLSKLGLDKQMAKVEDLATYVGSK